MAVPHSTPEQRAAALAKAAEARRVRAEVKELLKTGSLTLERLLRRAGEEPYIAGMKVFTVLYSLPGVGKVKAGRVMESIGIADNRRILALTDRQRRELLDAFS